MGAVRRHPRILGIDDGPFRKRQTEPVPVVGVVMEGAKLVEGVALRTMPVDGEDAGDRLAEWVEATRWHGALQGIVLGGVTIAGLGLVDIGALSARLRVPVIAVTRRRGDSAELARALETAGLAHRAAILDRLPEPTRIDDGLWASVAGCPPEEAAELLRACTITKMPEPLRLAHLIATAMVRGESHGRV